MADLIDPSEIMFTPFEPKVKNRFIMYIEGIPAYLIRAAARPTITFEEIELNHINVKRYVKGKGSWEPLEITLYDPIVPSGAQAVMEWVRLHKESVTGRDGYSDFYKKDITFNVLGPVGDKVEEWTLKGAMIQSANFGDLDYLIDETQDIAKKYGAVCTPDFFGYNKNLELQYRGRIRELKNLKPVRSGDSDLKLAMKMIAKTQKGPTEQIPSMGCNIKWFK